MAMAATARLVGCKKPSVQFGLNGSSQFEPRLESTPDGHMKLYQQEKTKNAPLVCVESLSHN